MTNSLGLDQTMLARLFMSMLVPNFSGMMGNWLTGTSDNAVRWSDLLGASPYMAAQTRATSLDKSYIMAPVTRMLEEDDRRRTANLFGNIFQLNPQEANALAGSPLGKLATFMTGFTDVNKGATELASAVFGRRNSIQGQYAGNAGQIAKNIISEVRNNPSEFGSLDENTSLSYAAMLVKSGSYDNRSMGQKNDGVLKAVKEAVPALEKLQDILGTDMDKAFKILDKIFGGTTSALSPSRLNELASNLHNTTILTGRSLSDIAQLTGSYYGMLAPVEGSQQLAAGLAMNAATWSNTNSNLSNEDFNKGISKLQMNVLDSGIPKYRAAAYSLWAKRNNKAENQTTYNEFEKQFGGSIYSYSDAVDFMSKNFGISKEDASTFIDQSRNSQAMAYATNTEAMNKVSRANDKLKAIAKKYGISESDLNKAKTYDDLMKLGNGKSGWMTALNDFTSDTFGELGLNGEEFLAARNSLHQKQVMEQRRDRKQRLDDSLSKLDLGKKTTSAGTILDTISKMKSPELKNLVSTVLGRSLGPNEDMQKLSQELYDAGIAMYDSNTTSKKIKGEINLEDLPDEAEGKRREIAFAKNKKVLLDTVDNIKSGKNVDTKKLKQSLEYWTGKDQNGNYNVVLDDASRAMYEKMQQELEKDGKLSKESEDWLKTSEMDEKTNQKTESIASKLIGDATGVEAEKKKTSIAKAVQAYDKLSTEAKAKLSGGANIDEMINKSSGEEKQALQEIKDAGGSVGGASGLIKELTKDTTSGDILQAIYNLLSTTLKPDTTGS